MYKVANPETSSLLKGLGTWAGLGAGAGAIGMGLAHQFSPNDPNNPEHKQRSLLKSMLLGGAIGGTLGAGARSVGDVFSNRLANTPYSGLGMLAEKTSPPTLPDNINTADRIIGGSPKLSGLGVGTGTAIGSGIVGRMHKNIEKDVQGVMELKNLKLDKMSRGQAWMRSPMTHGGLAGLLTTAYGYGVRPKLEQEALINQADGPNLANIVNQSK